MYKISALLVLLLCFSCSKNQFSKEQLKELETLYEALSDDLNCKLTLSGLSEGKVVDRVIMCRSESRILDLKAHQYKCENDDVQANLIRTINIKVVKLNETSNNLILVVSNKNGTNKEINREVNLREKQIVGCNRSLNIEKNKIRFFLESYPGANIKKIDGKTL